MGFRTILFFLIFQFKLFSVVGQTSYESPFISVERSTVLQLKSAINIRDYRLSVSGDSLFVTSTDRLKSDGVLDCLILDMKGNLQDSVSFQLSKSDQKRIKRFTLWDVAFSQEEAFFLFANGVFRGELNSEGSSTQLRFTTTKRPFENLELENGVVYLSKNSKSHGPKAQSKPVYISSFDPDSNREELLFESKPESHFLLTFEQKKFFAVFEGDILYLHLDEPLISVIGMDGAQKLDVGTGTDWNRPTEDERKQYNPISDENPHRLVSQLTEKMIFGELSMNIRIDRVAEDVFAVTTDPGKTDGNERNPRHRFRWDIWKYKSGHLEKLKELEAPYNKSGGIRQPDGSKWFDFHNRDGNTFVYADGKRYQISIEPYASYHDNDQDRIKAEKDKSLLENKYELCLNIGELNIR